MKNRLLIRNYLLREDDIFYISDDWLGPISNKPIHTHDFYEFFIVTKGQITQIINNEVVLMSEKELQIKVKYAILQLMQITLNSAFQRFHTTVKLFQKGFCWKRTPTKS